MDADGGGVYVAGYADVAYGLAGWADAVGGYRAALCGAAVTTPGSPWTSEEDRVVQLLARNVITTQGACDMLPGRSSSSIRHRLARAHALPATQQNPRSFKQMLKRDDPGYADNTDKAREAAIRLATEQLLVRILATGKVFT